MKLLRCSQSPPLPTLLCLAAGLVVTLLLPDWTNTGHHLPGWMAAVPIVIGAVGAVFAWRHRRPGWALVSALSGLIYLHMMFVFLTIVLGP